MKVKEIDYSVKSQRKTINQKKKQKLILSEEGLRPQHQPYKKPKTNFKNYFDHYDDDEEEDDDYF
jgi:hypothetical protein